MNITLDELRTLAPSADIPADCTSIRAAPMSNAGGMSCDMWLLHFLRSVGEDGEGEQCTDARPLACKVGAASPFRSALRLAREADFYRHSSRLVPAGVTVQCHSAEGSVTKSPDDGSTRIILDVAGGGHPTVQLGRLFGRHPPPNWGVPDTDELVPANVRRSDGSVPTAAEATREAWTRMARVHGKHWQDREGVLGTAEFRPWLRGAAWTIGDGAEDDVEARQMWQSTVDEARTHWKQRVVDGVKWSDRVVGVVDSALAKADWATWCREVRERPWSLVHGDFHPANALLTVKPDDKLDVVFVDWEQVGVGSPAQELGQWVISHWKPEERRPVERELVHAWWQALGDDVCAKYTDEQAWHDYQLGGAGRWVWLLAYLSKVCPAPMVQYFHDQLEAFCTDHGITADTVGMVRV